MNQVQDKIFQFAHHHIAAKVWNPGGIPTLAVHGWLDNAASFDNLAPLLPELNIVAIDLTGHGLSSHKPPGTPLHILDFITDFIPVIDALNWDKFIFLGHSLGAALGSLFAGAFLERTQALINIDALGPMSTPAESTPEQYALFYHEFKNFSAQHSRAYANFELAVKSRLSANKMLESSCRTLLTRGLQQQDDGTFVWRTDRRLLLPSAHQLTEEQVLAFLGKIICPSLIIRPDPGFPFPEQIVKRRTQAIHHLKIERLKGHHHVHLDSPESVATIIRKFLVNI